MSHSHILGRLGECKQCGCHPFYNGAILGCNTIIPDDAGISCLNLEAKMSYPKHQQQEREEQEREEKAANSEAYAKQYRPQVPYSQTPVMYDANNPPPGSSHSGETHTMIQRMDALHETEDLPPDPEEVVMPDWEHANELVDGDNTEPQMRYCQDQEVPFMEPDTSCYESPDYHNDDPRTAMHFSQGKPPLHQLPREGLRAVADVFAYGETKYDRHNWKKGMPWSELLNSLLRHTFDFIDREDFDPESACLHMSHVAWNALVLIDYYRNHPEFDDRYEYPEEEVQFPPSIPPHEGPFPGIESDLDELSRDELYKVISDQAHTLWRQQLSTKGRA